jgi:Protein of unknown function (DUF1800)
VYWNITDEVENDIISPLAQTLRNNNFEIQPTIEGLLSSQHFFDLDNAINTDDRKGALIKSPLELLTGTLRLFNVDFGNKSNPSRTNQIYAEALLPLYEDMGIEVYNPFDVAGYNAYYQYPDFNRNWITASNLGYRYQMIDRLLAGLVDVNGDPLNIKLDVMPMVLDLNNIADPSDANQIIDFFTKVLFPEIIKPERRDYFKTQILLDNFSEANWAGEWADFLNSRDDTAVRLQLEALVRELIQSPEYQLF